MKLYKNIICWAEGSDISNEILTDIYSNLEFRIAYWDDFIFLFRTIPVFFSRRGECRPNTWEPHIITRSIYKRLK